MASFTGLTVPESPRATFGVAVSAGGETVELYKRRDRCEVVVFPLGDVNATVLSGDGAQEVSAAQCIAYAATPPIDGRRHQIRAAC